jgi:ATP-dependent Clp protease adaptor protein ClpS
MTAGERFVPDTPIYKMFLLNDEYTPMEFVVHVLERIFDLDRKDAEQLMLRVHNDGIAECGAYPREDAEKKLMAVRAMAQEHRHPLQCLLERQSP